MPDLKGFDRQVTKEDRAHAKRYDAWFRSLPKAQQERMREMCAGPYSEARVQDHVFPIYESSKAWSTANVEEHEETESFMTREEVARIVADVVDMLGYTDDPKVRRHWELMRLVLRAPGHRSGKEIGEMFGVTKQAIKARWNLSMDQSEFGRIKNLLTASCATSTIAPWGTAPAAPTTAVTTPPTAGTSPAVASATTLAPVVTNPSATSIDTTMPAVVGGVREVKPVRCKKAEFGQTGQYQGVPYVCSDRRKDGTAYAAGYYMWRPA